MIWTDKTHNFAATTCKHLGRPCPAAVRMVGKLAEAMTKAAPMTAEDFEICGHTTLDGCTRKCPAQFISGHDRIRIYCGVDDSADRDGLERFADAILASDGSGFSSSSLREYPCALAEGLPQRVSNAYSPRPVEAAHP